MAAVVAILVLFIVNVSAQNQGYIVSILRNNATVLAKAKIFVPGPLKKVILRNAVVST